MDVDNNIPSEETVPHDALVSSLSTSSSFDFASSSGDYTSSSTESPGSCSGMSELPDPWDPAYISCSSSPYFSSRIQNMIQHKCEYNSELEFEIENSKVHWSEVRLPQHCAIVPEVSTEAESEAGGVPSETDLAVFENLQTQWGRFFKGEGHGFRVGKKIAEGGQAEIYEADGSSDLYGELHGNKEYVVKVFKRGYSLRALEAQWPLGMLQKSSRNSSGHFITTHSCPINGALMLQDNRFAFLMWRYWGDLRKLIDFRMQHNGTPGPPFRDEVGKRVMFDIAKGMAKLHEDEIVHRDLKASNVLVRWWSLKDQNYFDDSFYVAVADFECSVGVMGTAFWRPPEVLVALRDKSAEVPFGQKSDVYSYAMTCYEIASGVIPFESSARGDYDAVLSGDRPTLPKSLDPRVARIIDACWHTDPEMRPSFADIVEGFWTIMWT